MGGARRALVIPERAKRVSGTQGPRELRLPPGSRLSARSRSGRDDTGECPRRVRGTRSPSPSPRVRGEGQRQPGYSGRTLVPRRIVGRWHASLTCHPGTRKARIRDPGDARAALAALGPGSPRVRAPAGMTMEGVRDARGGTRSPSPSPRARGEGRGEGQPKSYTCPPVSYSGLLALGPVPRVPSIHHSACSGDCG